MAHHDTLPPAERLAPDTLGEQRLRRYLPPALADELLAGPHDARTAQSRTVEAFVHLACARAAIAGYLPRMLGEQLLRERQASPWLRWLEGSLLFADLSGSTALADRLGALGREGTEMVTACLNQIFAILIQVIHDYGGDLVAFGGDALLVFFGDDRHPRTAARAALALQEAMRGYVQVVPGVGRFPMHLHVGVDSGRVAFVTAGSAQAQRYGVLGATVNRVATAEAHARPGEVVAGPGAWAALATFARAVEVAPGFHRIGSMRAPARPHLPLADEEAIAGAPAQAIPLLLDDLDRISPYVPEALLRRILAEPQLPQIEADLRPVSVLFAQVAGLEALAEALPPELAAAAVQLYVGAMQAAIERFGGVVNKIDIADEGAKLLAIFGAPAAYEDHAERAARAALEMQDRIADCRLQIADYVAQSAIRNLQSIILRQRIGLNLGTAFAGNVGSAARKEYTVMGDAVNVAARVMAAAEWGAIWCSEATARAIEQRVLCHDRGELAVKGKPRPLQLFELAGERDTRDAAPAGDEGPLVGRSGELDWLRARLQFAIEGAGRAARVAGEAGVGKSRLVGELVAEAERRGVRVIGASCFSYSASMPYAAWGEWLKSLCGIISADDEALRERKIAARLAELGPGMADWLPILGDLARLDVPENRLTRGLDPQIRQSRRFELLEQLLRHAAHERPVLALFEDLHWADPISLALWRRVAGNLAGQRVLLLGVHRPAAALDDEAGDADLLPLKELSKTQSGELVAALAGDMRLPETVTQKLVERAAGNPLFLAELLRAIQAKLQTVGVGLQGGPQEIPHPIYNLQSAIDDLPDSLNGLLLSRIDRLDENSRAILRIASVIGQRIPFGVLQAIQGADQQALLRELARLDAENMTQLERLEPERVHAFRHALTQEVAYQSMLYARRRELHGRIGEYLERRYAGDLDDYYGLLAHHYRLSDRRDKAAEYLAKAGDAAQAVFANDEAIQYFGWAIDALAGDADPRAWEARDALGDVYATVGRYDDALAQHDAILAAPGVPADTVRRAHRKRGNVLEKQGRYAEALHELDQAMAIARSGTAGIIALAIPLIDADIALVRKRRGEYDLAIAACEEGLRAIRSDPNSFDDEKIEARLHSEIGGIYGWRGDYARSREHFEHSLRLRSEVDDLRGMAESHNNLGYLWQLQNEYERAIEHYLLAEELARKINLRYTIVFATLNMAYALISLSRYPEAERRCAEALALSREINAQQNIAQSLDLLGLIAYHVGDYDRALATYDEALRLNRSLGSAYHEGSTLIHIALALNAQGQHTEAAALAAQALDRAEALGAPELKAESLNALAEAALGRGDQAGALGYAAAAADLGEITNGKREAGITQRLLGQIAAAGGQPFDTAFDRSLTLLASIDDRFELGRTFLSYGMSLIENGNQSRGETYLKRARDTFISIGANGELQRLSQYRERSF